MKFEEVWRQIKRVKVWYNIGNLSKHETGEEILKPLSRIIDFERQECIYENNFAY
ncbi:MAG: hypothetical protein HWN65_19825 [Candidatus Helarchaeota archaeon]|nr:hypothetical protein [Candidatus Helarchaeota archaeon]